MAEATQSKVTSNSNSNISSLLDTFTSLKREIYSYLNQALELDEKLNQNKEIKQPDAYSSVIILYEKSLALTEKALNYFNINKDKLNSQAEALSTLAKLNSMRDQAINRLNSLKSTFDTLKTSEIDMKFLDIGDDVLLVDNYDDDIVVIDDLPPYPGVTTLTKNDDCVIVSEKPAKPFESDATKATELYRLENCAQLFYIGTDGSVSTPSSSKTLSIYSFDQDSDLVKNRTKEKQINGFIKCGDWMYPLVPNDNPGMKTSFNAYIFPNNDTGLNKNLVNSSAECSFVGITFDSKNMIEGQATFFEDILTNLNSLVYQDTKKTSDVKVPIVKDNLEEKSIVIDGKEKEEKSDEKIAAGLIPATWSAEDISDSVITGAGYLSRGVATTSEYAVKYMGIGGEKLKSSMTPNSIPSKVDPTVKKSVEAVRYGTNLTVKCSGFLVTKLGQLATYTAKAAAPHVRKGASSLMTSTGLSSNKTSATGTLDSVCKVGSSSLKGFVMVIGSLEEAAFSLGRNFTEQTVTVVDHKYGGDAAKLAEDGCYTVGNVAQTVNNYKGLKITKTFAKAGAKEAIKHNSNKSVGDEKKLEALESDKKK